MSKINVLLVVSEFYQSGTSRFTYEIDSALNKEEFTTSIISLNPLNNSPQWVDYYNLKHEELGTKLYFFQDINRPFTPSLNQRFKRKLFGTQLPNVWKNVVDFLDKFDVISVMGEYNYPYIKKYLTDSHRKKLFIHPQNSVYQKSDNYSSFEKSLSFNFVSAFTKKDTSFEFKEFESYKHTYLPLSFKIANDKPLWRKSKNKVKKVGLFSRLGRTKPIDSFIYSFQILSNRLPDVELHIFGSGDPEKEGVLRYVRQLNLQDKIKFRGHQEKMVETALHEKLDLVWLHGYHSLPGGWAGYDIASVGIPQVFWDFGGTESDELSQVFPMTNNVESMAVLSKELIENELEAIKLSNTQFEYTVKNQEIRNYIVELENAYKSVIK